MKLVASFVPLILYKTYSHAMYVIGNSYYCSLQYTYCTMYSVHVLSTDPANLLYLAIALRTVLYSNVLYCTVLYCTVRYCTVL